MRLSDIYKQQDNAIKVALCEHGFDCIGIEFIKEHFTFIDIANDKFKHLYYHFGQPDEIRIISIEKEPVITQDFSDGNFTIKAEQYYY